MRVLLISITAGYGHHATAKAIGDELTARGAKVTTADLLQYVSKTLYDAVDKGYLLSTKYARKPYRLAYNALDSRKAGSGNSTVSLTELIARRFANYFRGYTPDVIICTHPFPAMVINELKQDGKVRAPAIGIITDYTIHPFWESVDRIEHITLASELLTYIAEKKGIEKSRLLPVGIPVHPKFNEKLDKREARRLLGLDQDKETILVMGGSMGYGNMVRLVADIDRLDMGLQIVCVCGKNDKLRSRLELLVTKNPLSVQGFINNVEQFMDAADCIVTKPGGLTTTEAMAKGLPMILVNPIPGHEERNVDFMLNNGIAVKVSQDFSVAEAVRFMFAPGRLEVMRRSLELVAHPDATLKLCDFIFEHYGDENDDA